MGLDSRPSDSDIQRYEREAFALLHQIYSTVEGSTEARLLASRVADLAEIDRGHALGLLEFLQKEGLLLLDSAGPVVTLTLPGKAYIEQLAWRRQSVRRRWAG